MTVFKLTVRPGCLYINLHLFVKHSVHGLSLLGMIQQLRNAVVAPTGMGKNYGRIMPLLRQGWLVRQKIMHYGFLDNASQDAFAAKRKHPNCSQYYFFGRFPWAL